MAYYSWPQWWDSKPRWHLAPQLSPTQTLPPTFMEGTTHTRTKERGLNLGNLLFISWLCHQNLTVKAHDGEHKPYHPGPTPQTFSSSTTKTPKPLPASCLLSFLSQSKLVPPNLQSGWQVTTSLANKETTADSVNILQNVGHIVSCVLSSLFQRDSSRPLAGKKVTP